MKIISRTPIRGFCLVGCLVVLVTSGAQAGPLDVAVYTGYNDEPRSPYASYSANSGQPVPWYGSPNTTYYGNVGVAQAFDPDINAILLQNLGATHSTLTAAKIGANDLFTLDGIGGPVDLAPGANVILAGYDGSDAGGGPVTLTIDGNTVVYDDVSGALTGASPWIGGAESIPWTPIHTPTNGVPDSSSTLFLAGWSLIALVSCQSWLGSRRRA